MASHCWTFLLVLPFLGGSQTAAINKRPVTAIQPISCTSKTGEVGVCMYAWHCLLFKGTHLTTCFDGIFVGSCCRLPPATTPGPSNEVLPVEIQPPMTPTRRPDTSSTPLSATLDWRPVTSTSVVTSIPDQELTEQEVTDQEPSESLIPDQESLQPEETRPSLEDTSTTELPSTTSVRDTTEFSENEIRDTDAPVTDSQLVNNEFTQDTNVPSDDEPPVRPIVGEANPLASNNSVTSVVPHTHVPTTTELTLTSEDTSSVLTNTQSSITTPNTTGTPQTVPPTVKPLSAPPTTMQTPLLDEAVSTTPPNKTTLIQQNYREVCGKPIKGPTSRIVGGQNAHYAEWPWMISLRQWKKNNFLHKCGAALLNGQWAITAAHCVENVPANDILLRIGEFDVSNEKEPESYEERRVQLVASHHKFDPRTFEYDLALLRFYQPVRFRRNILPICIPKGNNDFVGKTATVTGWGRLYEDGPLPSVLQKVQVPVITNVECESMYKKAGFVEDIPDIFICAGKSEGGKDSCEGDSGGPMVLKDSEDRWLLAGIISWGIGCALPNQPGVYTRITKFTDWIESIIVH